MSGVRVFELAKTLGMTSKDLLALLAKLHVKAATHMASLDEETVAKVRTALKPAAPKAAATKSPEKPKPAPMAKPAPSPLKPTPVVQAAPIPPKPAPPVVPAPPAPEPKPPAPAIAPNPPKEVKVQAPTAPAATVTAEPPPLKPLAVPVPLTVKELGEKLFVSPSEIIKRLLGMKIFATINQLVTEETVEKVVKLYGYEYQRLPTLEERLEATQETQDQGNLHPRPPVVTLMGHVDHGKTSLLDEIRKSRVVEKEAGGITQHIGAYQVVLPKGKISFLDTPGHEAFTAMRARGAHVTDIVILVVAADDGVMPQTVEAIDHAKAAEATIVVALNKIDKASAKPDVVKKQLMDLGLTPEDWGGKTIVVPVSAKTGAGIDQLLEMLLLEAELLELKADPTKPARGIVLEAKLSKGGGPIAHVLVQNGTFHIGDVVVCGGAWGNVRSLVDDHGRRLNEAGPSTPAELSGLNGVPLAGELFFVVPDEKQAREVISRRQEEARGVLAAAPKRVVSLEDFHRQLEAGRLKSLNLILKADVQGSLEVLRDSLLKIFSEEVSIKILHGGVGDVTEPDVLLAEASNAVVIGFHVGLTDEAQRLAKLEQVDVRLYRIIYEAVADIRAALEGLLAPRLVETVLGRAKVLQAFKVSNAGTIAGSQVVKGKMVRGAPARVLRGDQELHQGKITSLKRFKDDAREITEGLQCGIGVSGWNEFEPGDIIEALEIQQVAQKL